MKNDFFNDDPELNITPLVDVMLVLVVILILIMPTIDYEEDISLPDGSKIHQSNTVKKDLLVKIRTNVIEVNDVKYSYLDFFDNFMLLKNKYDLNTAIYILGDKNISYNDLMQVLSAFSKAGFRKILLKTK